MVKGLERFPSEERLRGQGFLSWEERWLVSGG